MPKYISLYFINDDLLISSWKYSYFNIITVIHLFYI